MTYSLHVAWPGYEAIVTKNIKWMIEGVYLSLKSTTVY